MVIGLDTHIWIGSKYVRKSNCCTKHSRIGTGNLTGLRVFFATVKERWLSWSKAPVLKTGEGQPSVGSNPTLSAIQNKEVPLGASFFVSSE